MYDVGYWKRVYDTKEVDFRIFEDSNLLTFSKKVARMRFIFVTRCAGNRAIFYFGLMPEISVKIASPNLLHEILHLILNLP
jgi:hypothetical protein